MVPAALASPALPLSPFPTPAPTPTPASPFSLTAQLDDTALYRDARTAFSHLLPGRPVLGTPRPGDPLADAVVHLQDVPLTLRYRLEPPSFLAASAAELARGTAERWGSFRANAAVQAEFANRSWLASWGVDGAAVATYDIGREGDRDRVRDRVREDLFVLVRHNLVLLVTWTCPADFVLDPAYAAFASVAEATMVWDGARWDQVGRVWPESVFAGPGLRPMPKPRYHEAARALAHSAFSARERRAFASVLAGIVSGAGAPWVEVPPGLLAATRHAILGVAQDGAIRRFVELAFDDVRTAHDLRAFAVALGRSLVAPPR